MERGRQSCFEQVHARQVWLLGMFGCHIFWACPSSVSQDYHSPASVGVGWMWGSPCFPGLRWELKSLVDQCALQECWAGVVQLFWHQVSLGFQSCCVPLFLIPQCGYRAITNRREASGWEGGEGRFNSPSSHLIWIEHSGVWLGLADPHCGCSPLAIWGPPCNYCDEG